jgi:undecaprenyl-diphosphatase
MPRFAVAVERIARWDTAACLRVNQVSRWPWPRRAFRFVSRLGDGLFWYALMLALALGGGNRGRVAALHLALTGIACAALYKWLKGRTARPRPCAVRTDIVCAAAPLDRFSFPSGHTLHAAGFSVVALSYYPALAPLLVPFTVLVAASRPVLGLHYPSDVLAGGMLGALVGWVSLAVWPA